MLKIGVKNRITKNQFLFVKYQSVRLKHFLHQEANVSRYDFSP